MQTLQVEVATPGSFGKELRVCFHSRPMLDRNLWIVAFDDCTPGQRR